MPAFHEILIPDRIWESPREYVRVPRPDRNWENAIKFNRILNKSSEYPIETDKIPKYVQVPKLDRNWENAIETNRVLKNQIESYKTL